MLSSFEGGNMQCTKQDEIYVDKVLTNGIIASIIFKTLFLRIGLIKIMVISFLFARIHSFGKKGSILLLRGFFSS